MAGKKKKGGKKGKKQSKEEDALPEEPSEYDTMDALMLKEVIQMLKQQLDKAQVDRNYVQHERDTIESFYNVTKSDLDEHSNQLLEKDREMEIMEDNHRVEVRVYTQKVKHLTFEHQTNLKKLQGENFNRVDEAQDSHGQRETQLKTVKQSLRLELKERELSNEEEIEQIKKAHEKNLAKLREQFELNLKGLEERCEQKLKELNEGLELRKKVDIHEIEERKNLHINDLMKNHERAFAQIKNYYNDITRDNLRLIDALKNEIVTMKRKAQSNTKLMHDVALENKRLSEPLAAALKEVEFLRHELKGQKKDELSLRHAKARVKHLTTQIKQMKIRYTEIKHTYKKAIMDKNALYDAFETTIQTMHSKGEVKNVALEEKLSFMEEQSGKKDTQLDEVLKMAMDLDAGQVARVKESIDQLLDSRDSQLRQLQYEVAKAGKSFNDSLRTFTAKLRKFGIPEESIESIGFTPFNINCNASPAGLVTAD